MRKVVNWGAVQLLKAKGYSAYMAPIVWRYLRNDFFGNPDITLRQKLWAYKHGFLSDRIRRYGLTEANYAAYLPDLPYFKMHPINGAYSKWIDDKLTMRYVLSGYADYMPKYYYELHGGRVLPLVDCPEPRAEKHSHESVLGLLSRFSVLVLKPWAGSGGAGFYKLTLAGGSFFLNHNELSKKELLSFLQSLEHYIVTEYVIAHAQIRNVYPNTANTVRLVVVNEEQCNPNIAWASIKFGVKGSGVLDNVAAGALFCPVMLHDGALTGAKQDINGKLVEVHAHPDTGVPITGFLPHWDLLKAKVRQIGRSFPQLLYVGYDIIITDSAFKIIEMNSLPALMQIQQCAPLIENPHLGRFFAGSLNQ